ncbi:hypothetical protein ABEQ76_18110 [Bacillus velezensis]
MTAILCFKNKELSIILADRRLNWGRNQEGGYEDTREKLVNTSIGWAAGAGFCDYSDLFIAGIQNNKIVTTDDIRTVFRTSVKECKEKNPSYEEDINESLAIASWIGSDGKEIFTRIGLFKVEFGDKIATFNDNYIEVIYPSDYLKDENKISALNSLYSLDEKYNQPFLDVLKKMFFIFNDIAKDSKYVSKKCDIGISTIDNGKINKYKISGEIDQLIKELEDEKIFERLEVY